jgi:hypothetical protein
MSTGVNFFKFTVDVTRNYEKIIHIMAKENYES